MIRVIEGDCRAVLAALPAASVQCCVTSPPVADLAYCAGVIDSDGYIGVKRSNGARPPTDGRNAEAPDRAEPHADEQNMTRRASKEDMRYFPGLADFPGVVLWRGWWDKPPKRGQQYIADVRSADVTETVCACIRDASPGMVAITLAKKIVDLSMPSDYIAAVETEAAKRGARVLWWDGPDA